MFHCQSMLRCACARVCECWKKCAAWLDFLQHMTPKEDFKVLCVCADQNMVQHVQGGEKGLSWRFGDSSGISPLVHTVSAELIFGFVSTILNRGALRVRRPLFTCKYNTVVFGLLDFTFP